MPYEVRHLVVEFSALETSCWASSFFAGSASPGGRSAMSASSASRSCSARLLASWRDDWAEDTGGVTGASAESVGITKYTPVAITGTAARSSTPARFIGEYLS